MHGQAIPETYDIKTSLRPALRPLLGLRDRVTFHAYLNEDGVVVEPPNPVLLALHAASAQVAHLSGAAKVLDEIDRETEPIWGLSASPVDMSVCLTSAAELVRALQMAQVSQGYNHSRFAGHSR